LRQAAIGAVICVVVAFVYARSRYGRLLRATREDPAAARAVGASIYRQRLVAFTVSGSLAGLAGGLYVHLLPVQVNSVYLDLTFLTLAMLVVGGATSLFGAVVGALAISALDSWLSVAENGTSLFGWHIDLPAGTAEIVVGIVMAAILILKPSGLTGGRELRLPRLPRPRARTA
jgi:branched-chain amino acid transport system permease protein